MMLSFAIPTNWFLVLFWTVLIHVDLIPIWVRLAALAGSTGFDLIGRNPTSFTRDGFLERSEIDLLLALSW